MGKAKKSKKDSTKSQPKIKTKGSIRKHDPTRKKHEGKHKPKEQPMAWASVNRSLTSKTIGIQVRKPKPPREAKDVGHLPKTYTLGAEALKIMSERGGSAGSIVVHNFKNYNVKHIYALVMNTVKNLAIIKKLIYELKLMKLYNHIDTFLLELLVGDLLFGRGLKEVAQNSYAARLLDKQTSIEEKHKSLAANFKSADTGSLDIKYLRVNNLLSNITQVIRELKALGLVQLEYSKDKIKFKKFCSKFKSMPDNQFMVDFHFPDDLILIRSAPIKKIRSSDLIRKGKAVMQDKASFLAIEALGVKPNMTILDACCAPGMKTAAIAGKMHNKGKIFAFDNHNKRLASAKHLLQIQGVKCASLVCHDFSKVKIKKLLVGKQKLDAILIDPSCSGSGIHNRVDYKQSTETMDRLKKLQAFQVALLVHAIDDGHTDNIVYCTCSTATDENEQVIKMALDESKFGQKWQVAEIIPYWQHRGHGEYEFAQKCIRSDQDSLTNGFFVAKLEKKDITKGTTEDNLVKVKDEEHMEEDVKENIVKYERDEEGDSEDAEDVEDDDFAESEDEYWEDIKQERNSDGDQEEDSDEIEDSFSAASEEDTLDEIDGDDLDDEMIEIGKILKIPLIL